MKKIILAIIIIPLIILILTSIFQLIQNKGLYNASLYASKVKDDHRDLKIPKPILEGHRASNVIDGHRDTFWNGIDPHRTRDFIDISWDEPMRVEEIRAYFGENRYATELKITTPIEEIEIKNHNSTYFSQRLQSGEIKTISFKVENTITEDKITRIDEIAVLAKAPNIFVSFSMVFGGLLKQYWLVLIFYFLISSILLLLGREYAQKYGRSLFHNLLLGFLFGFIFLLFIIKNQSFENFVILDPYSLTLFLGQLLVIFAILFWPGRAIMELLFKDLSGTIKNAASFGISILIMAILAVLSVKSDQILLIPYAITVLFVLSLIFLAFRRQLFECFREKGFWKFFTFMVIFVIVYHFATYSFSQFYLERIDYIFPYAVARSFHTLEFQRTQELMWGFKIYDRTPLLALVLLSFMKLFNSFNVAIYFKLVILTPLLFFFPVYALLKNFLQENWLKILFIVILLNPYILYYNLESPTKFFAIYFLLVFYLFLLKPFKAIKPWQNTILAGIFGGLALLAHLYAVAFILAGFLYKLWRKPKISLFVNLMISGLLTALPALLYFKWIKSFHSGGSLLERMLVNTSPVALTSLSYWNEKWHIFTALFIYYDRGKYYFEYFLSNFTTYRHNLLHATTLSLIIFGLIAIFKLWGKHKKEVFFLFIVPILILIFGFQRSGLVQIYEGVSHIQPIILYLVVMGVWLLSKIKNRTIQYLFLSLFIIEHFYAIWFLHWDITLRYSVYPPDHPWNFAELKSFWIILPLIIIYALLITSLFKWVKEDNNEDNNENLNNSSDL